MEAILKREIIVNKTARRIIGVFTFTIFTSLGAFVRIPLPFTPVPITLQTFFVLLSGAFLGGGLGPLSQLSYIFLGAVGLPVFCGAGSGLFYLLGPTGGYLLGFILASLFTGRKIRYSKDNLFSIFCVLFTADLILLSCGVLWLKIILGYPFVKLLSLGLYLFLPVIYLKPWLPL
jgi:biotin transport system substrate-specific component